MRRASTPLARKALHMNGLQGTKIASTRTPPTASIRQKQEKSVRTFDPEFS
jgi:hypothetical protein